MDRRDIFLDALDRDDPADRARFLDAACAGDTALRADVEGLLRAHQEADAFLDRPLVRVGELLAAAGPAPEPASGPGPVEVRGGPPERFSDETTAFLRRRLTTGAFVCAAVLAVALVPTLTFILLPLRLALLAVVTAAWLRLRGPWPLGVSELRWLELLVCGTVATHLTVMPGALMVESARAGDVPAVIMDAYFVQGIWVLAIITYALLIPNTWPRALALMLPAGCMPYVTPHVLGWVEPKVAAALAAPRHGTPFPVALVAVGVGMVYAELLQGIRRDLHQARKFGQYQLHERLGGGGMGVVYRAEHLMLKRPCAIKLIRPGVDADAAAVAQFEREVRVTAQLTHWNTVEIYDYGRTADGEFYYVMELLRGITLDELVARYGPLPPGRAVYLLRQVCDALREAHALGLVHRDIKPANVFAARRGGIDDVVKLIDFGLVAAGGVSGRTGEDGVLSGTPQYMSPEQAAAGGVDARSDIYSLGALAYFLACGRPPFFGSNLEAYVRAHTREAVMPPSAHRPDVPADLEAVILRCLAKSPGERFPDVDCVARALGACACAGEWDAGRAAAWWREHAPPPAAADRPAGPLTVRVAPADRGDR